MNGFRWVHSSSGNSTSAGRVFKGGSIKRVLAFFFVGEGVGGISNFLSGFREGGF